MHTAPGSPARFPMKRTAALAFVALAITQVGCSLGQGEGRVHSDRLVAKDCWGLDSVETCAANGGAGCAFDLQPDFFAAVPFRDTLQIRVQRGNDLTEVSDGLSVLVDDIQKIRSELLGTPLCVTLPPGVAPPGSPEGSAVTPPDAGADGGTGVVDCGVPLVHMSLYLEASCHNQNIVLYAVSGTATFTELFSGDPNEEDADEKYTAATFDVMVGDPRDVPLGAPAYQIPEDKLTRLDGSFRFYFERGQPGQPFP